MYICGVNLIILVMSKLMNRNFRVKYGRTLVGYTGLVLRIGLDRANLLISKMLRTSVQKKSFKVKGVCVTFYCK